MQLLHLRGRKICDRVMRKGHLWKSPTCLIRWLPGAPHHPAARPERSACYAGTVASTKLSKLAVERNRMRRRCREALRLELKARAEDGQTRLQRSLQLLILPRSASLHSPFADIQRDIRSFLSLQR